MANEPRGPEPPGEPEYTRYRAGPRLWPRAEAAEGIRSSLERTPGRRTPRRPRRSSASDQSQRRRRPRPRRVLLIVGSLVVGWLALSLVLFLISAQTQQGKVSGAVGSVLDHGGWPLTSATNVLVLGSDQRTKRTHERGSSTSGPSRSDVLLLIRTGGGHSARLSIPRDTAVAIPGHGTAKINAAYAFGGAALAVRTVKGYLHIPIHHVVEVNFDNFPQLIDSLGGVNYKGGCVISRINGGSRNGGYTLRLKHGTTHINGKQALALARTRHNDCNRGESDLTRARRQQKLFSAMKSQLLSPWAFVRLPWIAWSAPQAIRSDMGGPSLVGLFGGLAVSGSPSTTVLKPSGVTTLPDGGVALVVSAAEKRSQVARFMAG